MICLPPAGGSADVFVPLAAGLRRHGVALLALEPPGRGRRRAEPPATTMDGLLALLLPYVRRTPPPYALLGHSMGALVALAMADRLRNEDPGHQPVAVIASAAVPPPGPGPTRAPAVTPLMQHLDSRASDERLLQQLVACGGLPESVLSNHHARRLLVPPLRADLRLIEEHRDDRNAPTRPLDRPILAFSGASDSLAPPHLVAGWHRWTAAGFAHHLIDGGHSFLARDHRTARRLVHGLGLLGLSGLAA